MSSGRNWIRIPTVGRIRTRLAEMLSDELGVSIEPQDIDRTNPCCRKWEDTVAWNCHVVRERGELPLEVYSWDTMTLCVRHGFSVERHGACEIEIHRKEPV